MFGHKHRGLWTQFVQKLEKNDPKCVYFYALANKCKGEKYDPWKGGWKKYEFQCNTYI